MLLLDHPILYEWTLYYPAKIKYFHSQCILNSVQLRQTREIVVDNYVYSTTRHNSLQLFLVCETVADNYAIINVCTLPAVSGSRFSFLRYRSNLVPRVLATLVQRWSDQQGPLG